MDLHLSTSKWHEVRDPIHNFVRITDMERDVVNSRPFQRLRHIHQLGMTHFVYPAATHTRFEHSLGVMELADRVFRGLMTRADETPGLPAPLSKLIHKQDLSYWRSVLRLAALCHDLGHLPFSHAAEKELLPEGYDHERMTEEIIRSDAISSILFEHPDHRPRIDPEDVAKIALGPADYEGDLSEWETIVSEIITGDAFGTDRMDYLLRDSYHAGVAYGSFDHYRLIDTLVLCLSHPLDKGESAGRPTIGVEEGGFHCAEALLLARYAMFSQMYFHHVRRIYDIHLKDFLKQWLPMGRFSTDVEDHVALTDHEVMHEILQASQDSSSDGHEVARLIVNRQHYRRVYEPKVSHTVKLTGDECRGAVHDALSEQFDPLLLRDDHDAPRRGAVDFTVKTDEGEESALTRSPFLQNLPSASVDCVFAHPDIFEEVRGWLGKNIDDILEKYEEGNNGQEDPPGGAA